MKYLSQAEFARQIGRSRSRVGQLLKENKIKFRTRTAKVIEIPQSEVALCKKSRRPAGRPVENAGTR